MTGIRRRDFLQAVGLSAASVPTMGWALAPSEMHASMKKTICAASGKKPNVILILCDDLGWGDLGEFWQNHRAAEALKIKTPHMDEAMRKGVMLTNAYTTAPVCVPARASMVTGKHQGHCNVRDSQFDKPIDPHMTIGTVMKQAGYDTWHLGKWGIGGGYESGGQPRKAMACDAGFDYSYGYPGHTHGHSYYHCELGGMDGSNSPIIENISGSEYNNHQGVTGGYVGRYASLSKGAGETEMAFEHDTDGNYYRRLISNDEVKFCYDTDLFTAKLKQLIDQQITSYSDKRFFAYACYTTVHGTNNSYGWLTAEGSDIADGSKMHVPPQAYPSLDVTDTKWGGGVTWEKNASGYLPFKGTADTANTYIHSNYTGYNTWGRKRYATAVQRLDDAIGDLRNFLKVRGIEDDTLIILTSDNGPAQEALSSSGNTWIEGKNDGFDSNGPFQGYKRSCYEGGVREPTFAIWPGYIGDGDADTPPKRVNHPFQFQAWMATLADVAGLPQPAHCDGVSILPVLTGSGLQLPSRIYSEWTAQQMVRDGDYVLVRASAGATPKLYKVTHEGKDVDENGVAVAETDLHQDRDIASEHPDKVRWMSNLLLTCRLPTSKLGTTGWGGGGHGIDNAALPAMPQAGTMPEWEVRIYTEGAEGWPWVPNFRTMYPQRSFSVKDMAVLMAALPETGAYGVSVRGWIEVPAERDVTFTASGTGGCQCWVHEAHALEWEAGDCAARAKRVTLKLAQGRHPFRLYLTTASGKSGLCAVTWA